ncbi:MAG: zinc-binding alcohol dehydrogenase [Acidobacteria bacterium]|nr:zinc-binding alcohol dehydrogenase [Acidobacteriota bacterium]MCA1650877.1 zinc-binding alcohol dehydrogenase [Acidobacteriota bacterium]
MAQGPEPVQTAVRALLRAPRDLAFEQVSLGLGPLAPQELSATTICTAVSSGTETAAYAGLPPLRPGPVYPRLMGYCNVACVSRTGSGVTACRTGDRILTHQSHQSAFRCAEADVIAVVPDGVSDSAAALSYLAQLGLTALQRVSLQAGEVVAVVGLGVIGLCAVAIAKALGAKVHALGNDGFRVDKARQLGADRWATADTPGDDRRSTADVVVTTANRWSAWAAALEMARPYGRIAVLGFPGRGEGAPNANPLDPAQFYDKQLAIFGCGMSGDRLRTNMGWILEACRAGRLDLDALVTDRCGYRRLGDVYTRAAAGDKRQLGVILDWQDEVDG